MAVSVVFTWECDICGARVAEPSRETSPYHDEAATVPPDGWSAHYDVPPDYRVPRQFMDLLHVRQRRRGCFDVEICDACPECQVNPVWVAYVERQKNIWHEGANRG